MSEVHSVFQDESGAPPREQVMWPSIVVPKADIDREIERLLDQPRPANGRRASAICHPMSVGPGRGLAPGTAVTVSVLAPGESTINRRMNATMVEITVSGSGVVTRDGKDIQARTWDVWNMPSMTTHSYRNDGTAPWVRLSYANTPVLEKLEGLFCEEFEGDAPPSDIGMEEPSNVGVPGGPRARDAAIFDKLSEDGAHVAGYEYLIDIDTVESKALHWPWEKISTYLPSVEGLNKKYDGRRLIVLYNPATERRFGTTQSFFATISCSPPQNNYIPHRHTSSAINYYLRGEGYSEVEGNRLEWKAGDLLLSAPSWAVHSHHSTAATTSALTIQDHPFHIAMESLVWQERMTEKIMTLGRQAGFQTNRLAMAGE